MSRYAFVDGETFSEGMPPTTPFAIASNGKMITAVAVLRLFERNLLGLTDAASDYLSSSVVEGLGGLRGVTIEHLLRMQSGLPDYFDDDFEASATTSAEDALAYAYGKESLFRPGQRFDYSNTNYVLLGLILENVTGKPYAQVVTQEVLGPAGMENAFVFGTRALPADFPNGHENGHIRSYYTSVGYGDGALIASATDLERFFRSLFEEGILLGPGTVELMLEGRAYGMGLELEGSIVGHSGRDLGFASDARYDLDTGNFAVNLVADGAANTDWTWHVLE